MSFKRRALERISDSVSYTESQEKGTKTGIKKPRGGSIRKIFTVKTKEVVLPNTTSTCDLYDENGDTDEDIDVRLAWAHTDEEIGTNKEAFAAEVVGWSERLFIGAECETKPEAAPPGHGDFIEASVTQTQAGAQSLNYSVNRITICDNDYDSVKMPLAELGDNVVVQNDTDNILRVWPNTDEKFAHTGENAHYDIPARTTEDYWAVRADKWMPATPFDNAGRTFDGVDDDVDVDSADVPDDLTADSFTITFEVLVAPAADASIKFMIQHGNGSNKLKIGQDITDKFVVGTTGGGVLPGNQQTQTGRYVIQYDTAETGFSRWKVWLNGSLLDTSNTTGSHTDIFEQDDDIRIGRRLDDTFPADMVIRDFRIYSALKTHAEIIADNTNNLEIWLHLNDANGASEARDYTENERNGTYNGTTRYEP